MEFGNDDDKIKKALKLQKAKNRYMKAHLSIDDEKIFRMSSVEEIIDALIENLKIEYADILMPDQRMGMALPGVAESISPYFGPVEEKRKKDYEKKLQELEKAKFDYINTPGDTVSDFILRKEKETNLYGSDVYDPVGMGRDTYSNLRNNKNKFPKFETCVQLMFAFKIDIDEANLLLKLAGKAFSSKKSDKLVEYFIIHKDYDFLKLNDDLYNLTGKTIGCLR